MKYVVQYLKFLSRLCGGEYDVQIEWFWSGFLSRLCGGEYVQNGL